MKSRHMNRIVRLPFLLLFALSSPIFAQSKPTITPPTITHMTNNYHKYTNSQIMHFVESVQTKITEMNDDYIQMNDNGIQMSDSDRNPLMKYRKCPYWYAEFKICDCINSGSTPRFSVRFFSSNPEMDTSKATCYVERYILTEVVMGNQSKPTFHPGESEGFYDIWESNKSVKILFKAAIISKPKGPKQQCYCDSCHIRQVNKNFVIGFRILENQP